MVCKAALQNGTSCLGWLDAATVVVQLLGAALQLHTFSQTEDCDMHALQSALKQETFNLHWLLVPSICCRAALCKRKNCTHMH